MACIRLLDRTDVMTTAESFLWREELRGQEDGDCFFNTLRRHLAKRFSIAHWYLGFLFLIVYSNMLSFLPVATDQVRIAFAEF